MEPPGGQSESRPPTRSSRILGLLAAVGFSVAMWVFIAMAVIGLILKIVGPKDAGRGLSAAGASMSQIFNLDGKATDTDPANGLTGDLGAGTEPITTLNGQPLESAPSQAPAAGEPGKAPTTTPARPEPATAPH